MTAYTLGDSIITVRVLKLLPFGLLVRLDDGRTGTIRKREIAWDTQDRQRWREHFKLGDTLQVVQVSEGQHHRLEFSLRLAQKDPWNDITTRYHVGQVLDGVVTGVQRNIAFVEIEPGVAGILHESRLPGWLPRKQIADVLWPGDRVRVMIEMMHPGRRRLRLSLTYAWLQRWKMSPIQSLDPPIHQSIGRSEKTTYLALDLLHQGSLRTIMVVEDDHAQRDAVAKWLRQVGQYTVIASSAEEGLALLKQERPDLVFMDLGLPGMNGIEGIRFIHTQQPNVRCVLMTDWASANQHLVELESLSSAGVQLLIKPFLPEDLLDILIESPDTVTTRSKQLVSATMPIPIDEASVPSMGQFRIKELISQLASIASGTKVILFKLDGAQRKISIIAEAGTGAVRPSALIDLIYSPVRDVAEDRSSIRIEDVQYVEALIRYLKPLLKFRSMLGIPVPGDLPERYALFLFSLQPNGLNQLQEAHVQTTAMALGALLEHQQFRAYAIELQRLALLGQLSRALVHEVNHRLNPINFAISDLQSQYAMVERLLGTTSDGLEREVREASATLSDLTTNIRHLTDTARMFGRMTTQRYEEQISPYTIIADTVHLVRDLADRAHVTIEIKEPTTSEPVMLQSAQVQQILLNIVINAIQQIELVRPREGGRVQIRIMLNQDDHDNMLRIEVEDDGPGIHRRLWERIFELGFSTRREGGSGLGLYITHSLVNSLGGRVYVADSYIGWGSMLVVELPTVA
jgi:signal transduction histidine kinase/ActR/RegA family two-component response regulator/predicted RNA-binding protein with RPS1 domain